ncbi:MAG: hypothetical protein Kow0074_22380 [Candidatus Zixiibacteriota bacterium]
MEWITHTATGFFVGQAMVKPAERPKRAGWWWIVASVSPDWLEVITTQFGDIHRGVTHSLYLWPLLALAWAAAARRWGGKSVTSLRRLFVVFFAVVGSHLLLDILMSYRLYFAWPFTDAKWSFGIMPFYDLYIFVGWVLLLFASRWRKWPSMMTAKVGLLIVLVMFSVRSVGKLRIEWLAQSMVADRTEQIETRPTYYQPWIMLVRSTQTLPQWTPIDIISGAQVPSDRIINRWFPPIRWRAFFRHGGR